MTRQAPLRRPAPLQALTRGFVATHVAVMRLTRGRVGAWYLGAEVVLLTTTGRRSGRPRAVPVIAVRDGTSYVVATVNGGLDAVPAWWLNLRAHPQAVVTVRGHAIPVTAAEVTGEERDALWHKLSEVYRGYESYQRRMTRTMAVVRLTPSEP